MTDDNKSKDQKEKISIERNKMNSELREMNFELHEMNFGLRELKFGLREINLSCEVLDSQSHRRIGNWYLAVEYVYVVTYVHKSYSKITNVITNKLYRHSSNLIRPLISTN